MKIHVGKRLFLAAAVLGAVAVFALAFLVAPGLRSVVAGPDGGPAAAPPNPGHSWSEIGDLPGTMWHSNNDGAGSGLDADVVDGQQGAYYQNATNINAGTLGTDRYSAYSDLGAETYLGNAAGDLAQNNGTLQATLNADLLDGQQASAFAGASHSHDTSYWRLTGNSGTAPATNFLGTTDNQALELRVNGARALRLEPNATSPNVIASYSGNAATAGVAGAAICGGGSSGNTNRVTDNYGTVGGGGNNQAGDNAGTTADRLYASVGGGSYNTASGPWATVGGGDGNTASAYYSSVGGGYSNLVTDDYGTVTGGQSNQAGDNAGTTGDRTYATVGGGYSNEATGSRSTVGGGYNNTAGGEQSTICGGANNFASGNYSFAAGTEASATHAGSFVWASAEATSSFGDNTFTARTHGGARFYTAFGTATGVQLSAGGNAWSSISDRNVKENFTPVDGQEILASLAEMPITTWNLKSQNTAISHMGPVAQDFYAAFGLGEDERYISTVDADGVALAAIQGLYALSQDQAARIQALEGGAGTNGASSGPLSSGLTPGWLLLGGLFVAGLVVAQRRRAGGRP